jgi:hypothetical protein
MPWSNASSFKLLHNAEAQRDMKTWPRAPSKVEFQRDSREPCVLFRAWKPPCHLPTHRKEQEESWGTGSHRGSTSASGSHSKAELFCLRLEKLTFQR